MIKVNQIEQKFKVENHPLYYVPVLTPFIDAYFKYSGKHRYKLFQGYIPRNEYIINLFLTGSMLTFIKNPKSHVTKSHKHFKLDSSMLKKLENFLCYFIGYSIHKNGKFQPLFIYTNSTKGYDNYIYYSGFYQNIDYNEQCTPYKIYIPNDIITKDFYIESQYNHVFQDKETDFFKQMSDFNKKYLGNIK